jgi:hypothetical protein
MTRDEILALSERGLDAAVSLLLGDTVDDGWIVSTDGTRINCEDGGPRYYSGKEAVTLIERFRMTVTPKMDVTPASAWLADFELKGEGELWWGFGPTVGVAVCRALLLREAD